MGRYKPGDNCGAPAGSWEITIDRGKCEGKAECVDVCPFAVFEVRQIEDDDFARLGWFARLKSRAHGRKTAYTPHAERCQACGMCVVSCPEKAITIVRRAPAHGRRE